jgi:hypothetical protein
LSIAALALIVAGCGFTGPRTLEIGRPLYNLAVQRTNTEQLLLNLVRLRYRDTPLFLQVASVSSSYEIETEAEAAVQLEGGMRSIWNLFFGGRVMEVPTVTYTPLQGQAFVRQLMDGIDLETLLRLYHSGWGVDRIFRVCLQEMNDVPNAPTASGPTPSEAPEYEDFLEVVRALRRLQQQRVLELGSSADERELVLLVAPRSIDSPEWHTVTRILSLPPGTDRFRRGPPGGRGGGARHRDPVPDRRALRLEHHDGRPAARPVEPGAAAQRADPRPLPRRVVLHRRLGPVVEVDLRSALPALRAPGRRRAVDGTAAHAARRALTASSVTPARRPRGRS